ncbi:MAG: protein O-GlcNAcase [Gemmatimonadaceae bacterium]
MTPAPLPNAPSPFAPGFADRGVIEGFYGPPWSHQDRLDMIRFMGRVGMNVYFYGPKDDPFHREKWREPYPPDQIARIGELVRVGAGNGVNIWFAISPGLSMTYSDSADYRALLAKLDAVAAVGVRHVAFFVDDVPQALTHAADQARFTSVAQAHAYVITRLKHDLDARGLALAVVPTTYTNSFGSRDYLRELGQLVPKEVPLAWTGIDVVAPDMTAAEARDWSTLILRPPFVWDNYPVNDFARWRLFLGPLRGRSADLETAVAGFVANPMNEAHASMLPLWTVADYLKNPQGYNPDSSLARAMDALYGAHARVMQPFVAAYGDDWATRTPVEALYIPSRSLDLASAAAILRDMRASLDSMHALAGDDSATWTPLARELAPFVDSVDARFTAVQRDTMYRRSGNTLTFREALDRLTVRRARKAPVLDGATTEWPAASWRKLFSRDGLDARAAMLATTDTLYVAIDVADTSAVTFGGDSATTGDHVTLVIGADPTGGAPRMSGEDLVLVATPAMAARSAAISGHSFALTPFYQEILVSREAYVFPGFLFENFGRPAPASFASTVSGVRAAGAGDAKRWRLELAIPRAGIPVARTRAGRAIRMAIDVSDAKPGPRRTASLGPRNYPANPATYTQVLLPQ